jgi:3-keto-5-aminohexanoate cleavage enzyme
MEKAIISVATTGGITTREQTPYVPITEEEIAEQAIASWKAGASILHVHVRDEDQLSTCDPDRYARVRELVRAEPGCDMIINMSTGGRVGKLTEDERIAPVRISPEIASYDCGSINFGDGVFVNSPQFLEELAREMKEYGVKPEIECFDTGMVENAKRIIDKGLIEPPFWFQFVLGIRGGAPATVEHLNLMINALPEGSRWSVCAIGRHQLPMNAIALALGGHPRTGIEDNIYYSYRVLAESNQQLVARVARLCHELERPIATPAETREMLGLPAFQPEA